MPKASPWKIENHEGALEQFPEARPALDEWLAELALDPRAVGQRDTNFPNLWYAAIPGTRRGRAILTCSYRVEFKTGSVWCDTFVYQTPPFIEQVENPAGWPEE